MKRGLWFLLSSLVVLLDQVSKYWVSVTLIPFKPVPILPILNLNLAYNTGAAFGFLNTAGDWHKLFFAAFSLVMSLVLTIWLWRATKQDKFQATALSLILGGALGNLLDRALNGYVIDFIDVFYKNHHFATFNIADSAICLGAFLLFFELLFPQKQNSTKLNCL
ncbi:MAG: lipoprotein signal peptidase [Legionella sp.]|nr:lipoprotein signal peptidase [Legionella sp.]